MFFLRPRGVPEFVTPPREPSRNDLQAAFGAQLAAVDKILDMQANRPARYRNQDLIDRLLDERLALGRAAGGAS